MMSDFVAGTVVCRARAVSAEAAVELAHDEGHPLAFGQPADLGDEPAHLVAARRSAPAGSGAGTAKSADLVVKSSRCAGDAQLVEGAVADDHVEPGAAATIGRSVTRRPR